jgi:hypothetical protein
VKNQTGDNGGTSPELQAMGDPAPKDISGQGPAADSLTGTPAPADAGTGTPGAIEPNSVKTGHD